MSDLIWTGRDADDFAKARVSKAQRQSELSFARVAGMKIAAKVNRPSAARGPFPWPHRTCAEWTPYEAQQERRAG